VTIRPDEQTEVDMALVRRGAAASRAPVSAGLAIPHQGAPGVTAIGTAAVPAPAGHEQAAAVPSRPATAWAMVTGLGLTGAGAVGAWNISTFATPTTFRVGDPMITFATLFVMAAAVERVLEPFSRWMPGQAEQGRYEKAVADMDNGVAGATHAAAHYKAALDSARASRTVLMWGLATLVATLLSAGAGFYLLRSISADAGWHGVAAWADALVTGLIVGSGTKPLHDFLSRVRGRDDLA
jgi:hypothetical protein